MDFARFRQLVELEIFDYQVLKDFFKDLNKPRDKISSLIKRGHIVRVKKGLYVFGELWRRNPLDLEVLANLIYGPSCLSFEYALFHYGLLAERPVVVTSLSMGKTKRFETPVGLFEYRAIDKEKFKCGIEYRDLQERGGFFLASREKALADLVYRTSGIRTLEQLRSFLFEEMRVDQALFRELNFQLLKEIAEIYQKRSVFMMLDL